jgi:hypothetical protein
MTTLHEAVKSAYRDECSLTIKSPVGEHDMGSLPVAAIHRLAQYGAKQWLADAIAGLAKELTAEGKTPDEIKAAQDKAIADRWEAILNGTVGTRSGGPRLRGLDAFIRDVADERIKAVLAATNAKLAKDQHKVLPKGEAMQALREKFIAANADSIKAEAQRRMAAVASPVEVDLASLGL